MARRVILHVGLPKTGTTYLQSIAWANKDVLREQGVLLPGFGPRQHLWASGVVRVETAVLGDVVDGGSGGFGADELGLASPETVEPGRGCGECRPCVRFGERVVLVQ